jgi:hypothetical protein
MNKVEHFGANVSVYVDDENKSVEINWGAIGSVNVAQAKDFIGDMKKAIAFADTEIDRIVQPS